jgi:DNA topoisomerase-1
MDPDGVSRRCRAHREGKMDKVAATGVQETGTGEKTAIDPTGEASGSASRESSRNRARRNLISRLAAAADLNLVTPGDLTIERIRDDKGFQYVRKSGQVVKDRATIRRLDKLAIPPAYTNVFCAADPRAHIQAVGTDAAGRLQYRYHPDWTDVREALKARRLAHLIEALPTIRRTVATHLDGEPGTRDFACAAAIRLVERSAIRAGNTTYEQTSGSRGAATLCKTNVKVSRGEIRLAFTAKGGKKVARSIADEALAGAIRDLQKLAGKRVFQFTGADGNAHAISTSDLNAYLKAASGRVISVKDFRTLVASSAAVEMLAEETPATSARRRKSQILNAARRVADELANTPAVARKSYIHASVIDAFETGRLQRIGKRVKSKPFSPRRERLLLAIVRAGTQIESRTPAKTD